jgi:hypothetical protein
MTHDRTPPTPLGSSLRPIVRAVRRALWRHVGRFLTESRPRYGQGRPRVSAVHPVTDRRPLRLV